MDWYAYKNTTINRITMLFILAFVEIQVFFFPTSFNGHIIGNIWMVKNLSAFILILCLLRYSYIPRKEFINAFFLVAWLMLLTITTKLLYNAGNNDFDVSWASLSGFLPTLLIWCMVIPGLKLPLKDAEKAINFLSVIMIVWGWAMVAKIPIVINITQNLFSQLNDSMFENMVLIRGKPVMSFGTHSMAAFFILLVFYYNCLLIKAGRASLFRFAILLLLFLLVIPLRSNTVLVAMAVMAALMLWVTNNAKIRLVVLILLVSVGLYYYSTGIISSFVEEIVLGEHSSSHGIAARYLGSAYENNFKIVWNYIGVGFLRSESGYFRMNDSAIIYLFTQGNVIAVFLAYKIMYSFIKKNTTRYHLLTFCIFFIWEFISASTFISVKMVSAQLLTVLFINSIWSDTELDVGHS